MNVSSVGSTATQALQRTPEAAEVKKSGPDNDGDADDGRGVKAAKRSTTPLVNANGQAIGHNISTTA